MVSDNANFEHAHMVAVSMVIAARALGWPQEREGDLYLLGILHNAPGLDLRRLSVSAKASGYACWRELAGEGGGPVLELLAQSCQADRNTERGHAGCE